MRIFFFFFFFNLNFLLEILITLLNASGLIAVTTHKGKPHTFFRPTLLLAPSHMRVEYSHSTDATRNTRECYVICGEKNIAGFAKHLVLLDGGVQMYVEGLLTFQVTNVEKLTYQLGTDVMLRT